MATAALTVALSWALAGLMHWWPRLPARWRLRLSLLTSAAGIGFLVAGLQSEGFREAATTSVVVLGPATLTATASALASLYYYVLTAACLLLGFAGLVFGEPLARLLSRRWLGGAVLVAWLVTVMRFLLEKSAAPEVLTQAVGITWMAPVAGAYFAACLRDEGRGARDLARPLWAYAYLARGLVAVVGAVATGLHLGTHYDASPIARVSALTGRAYSFESGSFTQILWLVLVPQLVVWPLYTVAAGLLGGGVFLRLARLLGPTSRRRAPAEGYPVIDESVPPAGAPGARD